MADNMPVTPGSGANAATDECSIDGATVHVQRARGHGAPGLTAAQVEVSNTSTPIAAVRSNRQSITIVNRQLVAVYISSATATTSHFRLDPGDSVELATSAVINGITATAYTATGDAKVHVIELHD